MSENKEIRRRAIRYISSRDGVSYAVASHKITCMSKHQRRKFYRRFVTELEVPA